MKATTRRILLGTVLCAATAAIAGPVQAHDYGTWSWPDYGHMRPVLPDTATQYFLDQNRLHHHYKPYREHRRHDSYGYRKHGYPRDKERCCDRYDDRRGRWMKDR